MQPTPQQVERSLHALRASGAAPSGGGSPRGRPDVPPEVLTALWSRWPVRSDRLTEVRDRLAEGPGPSAQALADRIVGRLVCDRLR